MAQQGKQSAIEEEGFAVSSNIVEMSNSCSNLLCQLHNCVAQALKSYGPRNSTWGTSNQGCSGLEKRGGSAPASCDGKRSGFHQNSWQFSWITPYATAPVPQYALVKFLQTDCGGASKANNRAVFGMESYCIRGLWLRRLTPKSDIRDRSRVCTQQSAGSLKAQQIAASTIPESSNRRNKGFAL